MMEWLNAAFASPWGAVLIFGLRTVDVSMMTVRTIFTVRGKRGLAAGIGFVQMLFFILAVGGALNHLTSVWHVLGFAGGFAAGSYVGIWIEQRLAIGMALVRAVFPREAQRDQAYTAARALKRREFAVTATSGDGWNGAVNVLNVIVPRRHVKEVLATVAECDDEAVVSVEEVQSAHGRLPRGTASGLSRPERAQAMPARRTKNGRPAEAVRP